MKKTKTDISKAKDVIECMNDQSVIKLMDDIDMAEVLTLMNNKLSNERQKEIYNEGKRRLNLWLKHSTIEEMTVQGSRMRFEMSLGLGSEGYPFMQESWMKGCKFNAFVTDAEFYSSDYDLIVDLLFEDAMGYGSD